MYERKKSRSAENREAQKKSVKNLGAQKKAQKFKERGSARARMQKREI
jgi:hypothetical protein